MNEVKWFEMTEAMGEEEALNKAVNRQKYKRLKLKRLGLQECWAEEEIGFKQGILEKAEKLQKKELIELVVTPESISTRKAYKAQQVLEILRKDKSEIGMVFINMLQMEILWQYALDTETMENLIRLAQQHDVQILLATTDPTFLNDNKWGTERVHIQNATALLNKYATWVMSQD